MNLEAYHAGYLSVFEKAAAYGDLGVGGGLGQAFKYGILGPLNAVSAPLSIPAGMLQSGGGARGIEALSGISETAPTSTLGRIGSALGHSATYGMGQRLSEVEEADPALAKKLQQYLVDLPDDATGMSTAALAAGGILQNPLLMGYGLNSLIMDSGGQARFAEGLGGDEAGFFRRWFDPVGYSTKNIGYELSKNNPELAAATMAALKKKFG